LLLALLTCGCSHHRGVDPRPLRQSPQVARSRWRRRDRSGRFGSRSATEPRWSPSRVSRTGRTWASTCLHTVASRLWATGAVAGARRTGAVFRRARRSSTSTFVLVSNRYAAGAFDCIDSW